MTARDRSQLPRRRPQPPRARWRPSTRQAPSTDRHDPPRADRRHARLAADATPPFGTAHGGCGPADSPRPTATSPARPPRSAILATNQRWASWIVPAARRRGARHCARPGRHGRSATAGAARPIVAGAAGHDRRPVATTGARPTVAGPAGANAIAIVSAAEFDPAPGNGRENPEQLGRLTDGRTDTTWSTVCYRQPTMAPKDGRRPGLPAVGARLRATTWSSPRRPRGGRRRSSWPRRSAPGCATGVDRSTKGDDLGPGEVDLSPRAAATAATCWCGSPTSASPAATRSPTSCGSARSPSCEA